MARQILTLEELARLARSRDRLDLLVRQMAIVLDETRMVVAVQRNTIVEQRQAFADVKRRIALQTTRVHAGAHMSANKARLGFPPRFHWGDE